MKEVENIEKLLSTAKEIRDSIDWYNNTYKKESRYDKIGFGFNQDSRFSACDALTLYVSSWRGVYGDSGCSTIMSVNKEVFNAHLLKVLQADFFPILQRVAESIQAEAVKEKDKALKELQDKLQKINEL